MPPDLVFLLLDTARADAFQPWNRAAVTPAVERLAGEGWTYARARSTAPWTLPSTASLFTGRLPTEHGITGDCFEWKEGRPSSPATAVRECGGPWLPDELRARGYRTWAASCNAWISPWGGFDRGFDWFLHLHDRTRLPTRGVGRWVRRANRMLGRTDRGGAMTLDEFSRMLASAGTAPFFAFVNLMEVHSPYDPPRHFYPFPAWRRPWTRSLTLGTARFLSYNAGVAVPPPEYVSTIRTLYYQSARYADRLVGGFMAALRSSSRPAILVVFADHGENLGEHGLFHHNSSLHETLLRVPLAIWATGVDLGRGVVERTVSLADLASWGVRVADGEVAPFGPGRDDAIVSSEYESAARHNGIPSEVKEAIDPRRLPPLLLHAGATFVRGSMKYVAIDGGDDLLFDLDADPGERCDLLATDPRAAEGFADAAAEWGFRRRAQPVYSSGDPVHDEIAAHLSMLGYIE